MVDPKFLKTAYSFPAPARPGLPRRVYPLFLPFSGCGRRCLYCAQEAQTGRRAGAVAEALHQAGRDFQARAERGAAPCDLAFYGGTFTALDTDDLRACLDFAAGLRERGLVAGLRCSTRPDAVDEGAVRLLKEAGFSLVELGVQSFQDAALAASGRGYDRQAALHACRLVKAAGLGLGIQLMPGMPGLDAAGACEDVRLTLSLGPQCARLYPCLVMEGTGLARLWRQGAYSPWDFELTLDFLAGACLELESGGVAVIRMGLAPEPGLERTVLAGPRHPEMGNMARALALYLHVQRAVNDWRCGDETSAARGESFVLYAPRRCQGMFWGSRGALKPRYAALGLEAGRVVWWDREEMALVPCPAD